MSEKILHWSMLPIILSFIIGPNSISVVQTKTNKIPVPRPTVSNGFVTRAGTQLLINGQPLRFAGVNMPWLPFGDALLYTPQFQIDDALATAQEMGLTVVRSHDLGVATGCSNCIEPSLGVFNETALEHDDYVIKEAQEHRIHLIIPLTDNYHYPAGGKHNFTDWRGISDENQFFYNTQVIQDFEQDIRVLLNHVNIYTGVAYKKDPTIMAWETGNELYPSTRWTQTISTFIKSIDQHHLVIDGSARIDPNAASLTNVDIVSNHYYPKSIARLTSDATLANKARKVFIVGEFDWNDANKGDSLSKFLAAIEANHFIAGDVFWELWPHDDHYGYVPGEIRYMLHYPGDSAAMRMSTQLLRAYAYKMRGLSVPAASLPSAPMITMGLRDGQKVILTWRGTAGAASYTIERSAVSANGPWTVICNKCATDNITPWVDTASPTGPLWYRVRAYNLSGVAGNPSTAYQVAPDRESMNTMIDNLSDWSKTYAHSDNLYPDSTNSQYMNNDTTRVARATPTHEWIIWKQDNMVSFQAISYFWPYEPPSHFSFYTSADGNMWTPATPTIGMFHGAWSEYIYTLDGLSGVNYVKIVWNNTSGHYWEPQLGQVTIVY